MFAMRHLTTTASAALLALAAAPAPAQDASVSGDGVRFDGSAVTIDGVTAEESGYLVVHETLPDGSTASEPVSIAEVEPGEGLDIRLDGEYLYNQIYSVTLYVESNDEAGFQSGEDIPLADTPALARGEPVMTTFVIAAPEAEGSADKDGSTDS